jgi:carboxylesterase type B
VSYAELVAWYAIRATRTIVYFSENLNDLLDLVENFAIHTKSVYELETFYGDQTLHGLMMHAQDMVEQLEKFDEIIYLTENNEEGDLYDQEEQIEPDTNSGNYTEAHQEEKSNPTQIRFQL